MAFNFLQSRIEKTVKRVQKQGTLNEDNIQEILKEIRLDLLEADVNLKVVNNFVENIKTKALGTIVDVGRTSSQELLTIIHHELISLLGNDTMEWKEQKPTSIMFVGLQGSGKTTSVAKLAYYLTKKENYTNPLLVGLDIYRPAAIDQLEKLAADSDFDFYGDHKEQDVVKIAKAASKQAVKNNNDVIIYDTAGRLQTDEKLMHELELVKKEIKPGKIILVVDANSGQDILNVAKEFNDRLKISSVIISKLDSDAKGGAALSITSALNIPIQFIGTGERVQNLEFFHPDRMAGRILGLGDIETLTEKAEELDEKQTQEKMFRKILAGRYDLDDLLYSMEQMQKMGSLGAVTKLLPGMKINQNQVDSAEVKMVYFQSLINSMTVKEKRMPRLLKHPKRKNRILQGSGRTPQEFNDLLRQFEKSQKQMKEMAKYLKMGKMPNMSGGFKGLM